MQIDQILAQSGGLPSIARELGISEAQAASGAAALAPMLLGGFKKQAQSQPGGVEGLGALLGRLGGGGLLDEVLAPQPTNVSRGDAVLGEIFGSRDVSRTVAQQAAAKSGLDARSGRRRQPAGRSAADGDQDEEVRPRSCADFSGPSRGSSRAQFRR
jgi:hypothetical protein